MKYTFLFFAAMSMAFSLSGAAKLGEAAPELKITSWISDEKADLSFFKDKAPVVLFFWTTNPADAKAIGTVNKIAERYRPKGIAFLAVGSDEERRLKNFNAAKQLIFPVAVDGTLETLRSYWRPHDRIPAAAVVGRDGRLLWRGHIERLPRILDLVLADKLDLAEETKIDAFNAAMAEATSKKDYEQAVKLFDAEIARHPDKEELYAAKAAICNDRLKNGEKALATLHEAQKRFPGKLQFWELEFRIIRPKLNHREIDEFYDRLLQSFADRPAVLLEFVRYELGQPYGKQLPFHAYKVARAAHRSPKFKNKLEEGRVSIYYAQVLYYSGRVDLALEVSKKALAQLRGTQDYDKAQAVVLHYNNILRLSKQIEE